MLQLCVDREAIERYEKSVRPGLVKRISPVLGKWFLYSVLGAITLFFIGLGGYTIYLVGTFLQSVGP